MGDRRRLRQLSQLTRSSQPKSRGNPTSWQMHVIVVHLQIASQRTLMFTMVTYTEVLLAIVSYDIEPKNQKENQLVLQFQNTHWRKYICLHIHFTSLHYLPSTTSTVRQVTSNCQPKNKLGFQQVGKWDKCLRKQNFAPIYTFSEAANAMLGKTQSFYL